MNMHEEKLFVVCDIVEFVKQNLDKVRDFVVDDMTDEKREGYDRGIEMSMSFLNQLVQATEGDGDILVHIAKPNEEVKLEEVDLQELLVMLSCRVVAQNFQGE